jgi:serine/threonine-protein kinase RsbW
MMWVYTGEKMEGNKKTYIKELSSERKSLSLIETVLLDIKNKFKLNSEQYYNLLIAVTEAVNNAIIHGNKFNPDKTVMIKVECSESVLEVSVKDQGHGFDYENLQDPLLPENLTKESGRGIFIIKKIADKVEFNCSDKGTEIKIFFKLNI